MSSIQALREQRADKVQKLQAMAAKENWDAATDGPAYDALLAEEGDLRDRIKRIETANALAMENATKEDVIGAAQRVAKDQKSEGARLFAEYCRVGFDGMKDEDKVKIKATMSTSTGSQGGYTVQTEVVAAVIDALKAFGGMRRVATVITTAKGGEMQYPTSDGTAEEGELVAQNAQAAALDISFGTIALDVYKFSSKSVAVPIELLQDSQVDIEAFIRKRLVTRLGRITNKKFTIGSGSSEPLGLVTAVGTGVTGLTGATGTVTYDSLVDLQHSVDPAYRELGNTGWMMNDDSIRLIRKIKDGQSRPIFVPGYEESLPVAGVPGGVPDTLMGRPITTNQSMATMAASAKSILFGDFSFYTIRDTMDMQIFRFTDSAFMTKGQIGFLAFLRSGGTFTDVGGAVKAYANAAS